MFINDFKDILRTYAESLINDIYEEYNINIINNWNKIFTDIQINLESPIDLTNLMVEDDNLMCC